MTPKKNLFKSPDGTNHISTFTLVCSLFLLWGFCNGLIDIMDKHFQDSLHISKAQSTWVQSANYFGYFFMALPAGILAARLGYKTGIIVGLMLIVIGSLWFIPAIHIGTFGAFLVGLFILAAGLACLETVANPYTTVLGPPEFDATRINIAQSLNGIGWILGPVVGARFIFSSTAVTNTSNATLYIPYLGVAIVVGILAVVFILSKIPDIIPHDDYAASGNAGGGFRSMWSHPHFVLAVVAQFLYVAAQTGIFSFFINYIVSESPDIPKGMAGLLPGTWHFAKEGKGHFSDYGASQLLSYGGFALFLFGRVVGSGLLRALKADRTLAAFALINTALMVLILLHLGWISVASLFLCFFFMSIMFPTIFALGIHGLGPHSKRASSFIVMAIVGGATIPRLMGWIADVSNMTNGFVVPLVCFAFVAGYALFWRKLSRTEGVAAISAVQGHH